MALVQKEQDWSVGEINAGSSYRTLPIATQIPVAGAAITLPLTSTTLTQFVIPVEIYNLNKTWFSGTVSFPQSTTVGTNVYAPNIAWCEKIELRAFSGDIIAKVDNAMYIQQMFQLKDIPMEEYRKLTPPDGYGPCDTTKASIAALGAQPSPLNLGTLDYVEPQTVLSFKYQAPQTTLNSRYFEWNLGKLFKRTFFEIPSDMGPQEQCYLEFTWPAMQNVFWQGTSVSDSTVGAATYNPYQGATITAPTVTNFRLNLQLQSNTDKKAKIAALFKGAGEGKMFTLPTPVMNSIFFPIAGASTNLNQTWPLDISLGSEVRSAGFTIWDAQRTGQYIVDHSNIPGTVLPFVPNVSNTAHLLNYVTQLDGEQLQPRFLNCYGTDNGDATGAYQDFAYNKRSLGNSILGQHPLIFQKNPVHEDSFQGLQPTGETKNSSPVPLVNIIGGKPLKGGDQNRAKSYNVTGTLTGQTRPAQILFFAIGTKTVVFGPNIKVVS